MKFLIGIRSLAIGACALAFAASIPVDRAAAQLFGWGSSVPGRQMVSFRSSYSPGTVVVSFGDRRLYYVVKGKKAISYPIAIPKKDAKWAGTFRVTQKRVNPTWTPTPRMRRENPKLPAVVPGGHPKNPLGVRAIYVGNTLYRIHGTDAPWLIGDAVSSGCVRMFNNDVVHLYSRVPVGARIVVTWKKFSTGGSTGYASSYSGSTSNASFNSRRVFDFGF